MDRRELLKMVALLTGGAVIGGELFLTGCKNAAKNEVGFTPQNLALLDEIGETIIPTTTTPGAKAAKVGEFMKVMVTDCYTPREQATFNNGLTAFDEACRKTNNKSFLECTPQQRHDFLLNLEKEAAAYNKKRDEEDLPKREEIEKVNETVSWKDQKVFEGAPSHYYTMMKQLTVLGFFTSKTGMTETLRHVAVPGRYDGNAPYKKGEKAWAE